MHDTYSGRQNKVEFLKLPPSISHRFGLPFPLIKAMSQYPFLMNNMIVYGFSTCVCYEKSKNDIS